MIEKVFLYLGYGPYSWAWWGSSSTRRMGCWSFLQWAQRWLR